MFTIIFDNEDYHRVPDKGRFNVKTQGADTRTSLNFVMSENQNVFTLEIW